MVENIFGCSFHYGQGVWRKLYKLGMSGEYLGNAKFRSFIRMFLNMTFVPTTCVKKEFAKLNSRKPEFNIAKCEDFIE